MSYRIAAASSNGEIIDVSFGAANQFYIYEVDDQGKYDLLEIRQWDTQNQQEETTANTCNIHCGNGTGCGSGGGCGGAEGNIPKLMLIDDCRCILCKKIGFQIQKQLEKKAIASFDIEYEITGAIKKIASYFTRVDGHQTLRGIAGEK